MKPAVKAVSKVLSSTSNQSSFWKTGRKLFATLLAALALSSCAAPSLSTVKEIREKHRLMIIPTQNLRDGQFQSGDGTIKHVDSGEIPGDTMMFIIRGRI
jgi:hypothetical protein